MFPNLLSIGPFSIHTYGLFVAIGLFAGLMTTVRIGKTEGIAAQRIMDMGFIMILSALLGSRSMYVLMNLSRYCKNPLDVLRIWQGGLVFQAGLFSPLQRCYGTRDNTAFLCGKSGIFGLRRLQLARESVVSAVLWPGAASERRPI